jgi:hypothetical protein
VSEKDGRSGWQKQPGQRPGGGTGSVCRLGSARARRKLRVCANGPEGTSTKALSAKQRGWTLFWEVPRRNPYLLEPPIFSSRAMPLFTPYPLLPNFEPSSSKYPWFSLIRGKLVLRGYFLSSPRNCAPTPPSSPEEEPRPPPARDRACARARHPRDVTSGTSTRDSGGGGDGGEYRVPRQRAVSFCGRRLLVQNWVSMFSLSRSLISFRRFRKFC